MTPADQALVVRAVRDAQTILAAYVEPGPRSAEAAVQKLLEVLDRSDVVAAVDRLEIGAGEPSA